MKLSPTPENEAKPIEMRCRKAMWSGYGMPAGLCNEPAYGPEAHMRDKDEYWTEERIARCPQHGGPTLEEFQKWLMKQLTA